MSIPLEHTVDEAVYIALCTRASDLVNAIRKLLDLGCTPAQIEARIARRYPTHTDLVRDVRHAAEHLYRQRGATNE